MKPTSTATALLLTWLIAGCGDANTKEIKTAAENKTEATKPDKPSIRFVLDGRVIESADYSCSWALTGKDNIFALAVHYDREPKRVPPNVGFGIFNLKSITLPFSRLNGKLPGNSSSGQLFSVTAGLALPKGKPADMNELSFSDNYAGLESVVQLSLLDTTAKIVSGRFEGTVKNANGKTMKITEGKFERIPLTMVYSYKKY